MMQAEFSWSDYVYAYVYVLCIMWLALGIQSENISGTPVSQPCVLKRTVKQPWLLKGAFQLGRGISFLFTWVI